MRTLQEIEQEIAALKEQLNTVKGKETEVYTRIVGYYRSVKNWNKGKKEEYNLRKLYTQPGEYIESPFLRRDTSLLSSYAYFYRKNCPNCPPVKAFLDTLPFRGKDIDVDTEAGLEEARSHLIFAAPTVLFLDENGKEIFRAHTVESMKALKLAVAVQG
ncbi:MAG: anaerobic ribonucleoside-triphosphate reductase [Spirochaetota bacterium]